MFYFVRGWKIKYFKDSFHIEANLYKPDFKKEYNVEIGFYSCFGMYIINEREHWNFISKEMISWSWPYWFVTNSWISNYLFHDLFFFKKTVVKEMPCGVTVSVLTQKFNDTSSISAGMGKIFNSGMDFKRGTGKSTVGGEPKPACTCCNCRTHHRSLN